jgi:glucose-1-phosphate adenylyltransferase
MIDDSGGEIPERHSVQVRMFREIADVVPKTLAMVMAGGKGERLFPLTDQRSKPAVPFGGMFRLIDFVLSNLVNSGIQNIYVLTQYKAQSLLQHLQLAWVAAHPLSNFFILAVPAQMRVGESWYKGTADSVYQNAYLIHRSNPPLVAIFGADHVYFMDISQMIAFHLQRDADVTVATIPYPIAECSRFGVVATDSSYRILKFEEKVDNPTPIPGRPDQGLVSMGNYIFDTDVLLEEIEADAGLPDSTHDFGRDILPRLCASRRVFAYDFTQNVIPGLEGANTYWRDVGTIRSYYDANMDLKNPMPALNLYNPLWPVRSVRHHDPAAKVVIGARGWDGQVHNTLLGAGSVVSGAYVRDSVIGRNTFVGSGAIIEESLLLGHCVIREGARIRRTIIDHGMVIGPGDEIGYHHEDDARRFHVDESGIVVTRVGSYDDKFIINLR